MTAHEIVVDENGTVRFIYADDLRPLLDMGKAEIKRVSHVEPTADNRWTADLSPIGGPPALGPFERREDALAAELAWLRANVLHA